MATLFGHKDGRVSSRLLSYYSKRANGGVGLIIVENTAIRGDGVNYPGTLQIHSEKYENGLAKLASVIRCGGAAAALQLFHPGRQIHPKFAGNYPIAPSHLPCPIMGGKPKVLELRDIRAFVKDFVRGAVRAKDVGFDAVEIHGAHGYLVAQFLSPFSNTRNDHYGGDIRRRCRFAVEIVEGIRERLGDLFPIIFRISADEKVEGGLTLDQTKQIIPYLERAGVSAFHISAGCYPSMEWVVQPYLQPQGCLIELVAEVRNVTDLPVLAVGRINNPVLANSIIRAGIADLVCMGRALIADPDLPNKAQEGKYNEIRPCIACNLCITATGIMPTRCAVNPEMGREDKSLSRQNSTIKVAVIGGGPAGMEAALRAHSIGHEVRLIEKKKILGGQLVAAGVPDSKIEIRRLLNYYQYLVKKSGIQFKIGKPFDVEDLKEFQPDHIVIATGSIPQIPNFDRQQNNVVLAIDVLSKKMSPKGNVVVVGGGPVGLDVAEFAVSQGANVTIIEMKKRVGEDLEWNVRKMKIRSLKEKGVKILCQVKVVGLEKGFVNFTDKEGIEHSFQADMVIAAVGSIPHNPIDGLINRKRYRISCIGDCKEPRGLADAIFEAFYTAMNLSVRKGLRTDINHE
jgi:2,4-dienoyl-CoA reductase-like NADH-dependent reductase (Old Yellow Enzyme family)/thioredoxin reductase